MRIKEFPVRVFTICGAPKLDPITVVLQDVEKGHGRLIIECWGSSWAAYWGGMGERTLAEFVMSCGPDYIFTKLLPQDMWMMKKRDEAYLMRIVQAVQEALRLEVPA